MSALGATRRHVASRLVGKRILIVEDDYYAAFGMAEELAHCGAEILGPVPSLSGAFMLLNQAEAVDGAVLDIELRDDQVFPLAEELQRRGVPFAFATAYDPKLIPTAFRGVPNRMKPAEAIWIARSLFGQ